jgi:hypothetical protein
MKIYTLDEVQDLLIGKKGTIKRNNFEDLFEQNLLKEKKELRRSDMSVERKKLECSQSSVEPVRRKEEATCKNI